MQGGELIHHTRELLFGHEIFLDTIFMTWVTMAVIILFAYLATRRLEIVPEGMQNSFEMAIDFIIDLIDSMIGPAGRKMGPFLLTLFLFILIANMWGLAPKLTSPTNDFNTTFPFAIIAAFSVYLVGAREKGLGYFKHFLQPHWLMLPMNLLDEMVRPCTLAVRLFVNILVGEVLLHVLYNLFPPLIPVIWLLMCVLIGVIQAYVFTLLSASYLASAFAEDH
jgi:F-type H+-transporting ATPase subunit a